MIGQVAEISSHHLVLEFWTVATTKTKGAFKNQLVTHIQEDTL